MGMTTPRVIKPPIVGAIIMDMDLPGACSIPSVIATMLEPIVGNPAFDASMISFNYPMII
jgi:hypothetical protein